MNRVVLTPGGFLFSRVAPRYLTHAAPFASSKVPVQEIDVLVPHPGRGTRPCWAGQTCELFSTHQRPGPPAPGFRLVGRNEVEPFTVVRWRAPAPLRLQLSDLVASAPTHRLFPPLALYQTPQPVTTIRPRRPATPRGGGGSPAAASQQNLQLADLPPGWSVAPPQGVAKQVFACLHALPANQTSESVLNAAGPPGLLTVTSDVLTWRNRAAAERADRALRGSGGASCVGYALGLSLRRLAPKASGAARPVAAPIGAGRRALAYRGSIRANGVLAQGTTVYLTRGSRSALLLGFSVGRGVFPAPLLSKLAATLARRMSAAPPAR